MEPREAARESQEKPAALLQPQDLAPQREQVQAVLKIQDQR